MEMMSLSSYFCLVENSQFPARAVVNSSVEHRIIKPIIGNLSEGEIANEPQFLLHFSFRVQKHILKDEVYTFSSSPHPPPNTIM